MNKMTVRDIKDWKGKRALVRCDFNVPMKDGVITDENRIMGALPTIKYLMEQGAKVILCSHMGKPHSIFSDEVKLNKKEKKALQSDPVVQEESKEPLAKDRPSGGLSDEMRLQMIADFYHDQSALGKKPYVVFACDKFRLTISEEMPAKNINMCIGYVTHMVERGY